MVCSAARCVASMANNPAVATETKVEDPLQSTQENPLSLLWMGATILAVVTSFAATVFPSQGHLSLLTL